MSVLLPLLVVSSMLSSNTMVSPGANPPRLVVLISIDQFRADYVERFSEHYLPSVSGKVRGGFKYLQSIGKTYLDAHHGHVPTATGPGHATLMTGSEPSLNGIVGNDWFDPSTIDWKSSTRPKDVYCVADPASEPVNGGGSMSPKNLKVTTVGDELKLATGGKSKVVGIAFKDRASILMAGHAADTVIWFNGKGGWTSSTFYCPDKTLPKWVQKLNEAKTFEVFSGTTWEPLLDANAYSLTKKAPGEKTPLSGKVFSHELGDSTSASYYSNLTTSGFGNDIVFAAVEAAIEGENLGKDSVPDILVINLSSNDYVGHRYGPNSPETLDTAIRTDRMLSKLIGTLATKIEGGIRAVTIAVTADHGVLPIVEESAQDARTEAIRIKESSVESSVNKALSDKFGPANWCFFSAPNLYLNRAEIKSKGLNPSDVQSEAARAAMTTTGIYSAVTATNLWLGNVPKTDWALFASWSYNPKLSGDVLVFETPGNYFGGGTGTGHGSPWPYDSHVPILIAGHGISRGVEAKRVYTRDIAPTLCEILGIEYPTGNMGLPLLNAIRD